MSTLPGRYAHCGPAPLGSIEVRVDFVRRFECCRSDVPPMPEAREDFRVTCRAGTDDVAVSARLYHSSTPLAWLVLAHGAGAGHDSAFMVDYARALAAGSLATVTFNFPYIE